MSDPWRRTQTRAVKIACSYAGAFTLSLLAGGIATISSTAARGRQQVSQGLTHSPPWFDDSATHACAGGARDQLNLAVKLLPSSRASVVVEPMLENAFPEALSVALAAHIIDGHGREAIPASTFRAPQAAGASRATLNQIAVDLSRVPDGYYEFLVHAAVRPVSPIPSFQPYSDAVQQPVDVSERVTSAKTYIEVGTDSIREVTFQEWYENSGAAEMTPIPGGVDVDALLKEVALSLPRVRKEN